MVDTEVGKQVAGAVAGGRNFGFRLDFRLDFDELPEVGHGIEGDGVAVERVEHAVFLDGSGRFETEAVEDSPDCALVCDDGLVFLAGLRLRIEQWSLVGEFGDRRLVVGFDADPDGLVRLGEVAVGRVVVRVGLGDGAVPGRAGVKSLAEGAVVGAEFEFDLVHKAV